MAKYTINGVPYTLDDSIQGDELTQTLTQISELPVSKSQPAAPAPSRVDKIRAYADQTDSQLGLPSGTSFSQLNVESGLDPQAISQKQARGIAQVVPKTQASLEKQLGRKLDPTNDDDALLMHRTIMAQNVKKFGAGDDALRAYNGGWDKSTWGNPETSAYADKVAKGRGVTPFAAVRQDVDPATLNKDQDWLRASKQIYLMKNREKFHGTDAELADYGKDVMAGFNFNLPKMAYNAQQLIRNGSQEDKMAFLYMMDTAENYQWSWEGAGRAAIEVGTDVTNIAQVVGGVLTGGASAAARIAAGQAAKQGIREALVQSIGRAGIRAGIENGVLAAAQNSIKQGVEVNAGRKDSISLGELAGSTAVGAGAGAVLGTAGDLAVSKIASLVRGVKASRAAARDARAAVPVEPTVAPHEAPAASPVAPAVPHGETPPVNPHASPAAAGGVEAVVHDLHPEVHPTETPPIHEPAAPVDGTPRVPEALTEEEVAAASRRLQEGRLPEDNTVHFDGSRAADIALPTIESGARHTPQTNAATRELAGPIAEQLYGLDNETLGHTVEALRRGRYTEEERSAVHAGIQQYAQEMQVEHVDLVKRMLDKPDDPQFPQWKARADMLEERMAPTIMGNDALGSSAGSLLQQRKMNPDFKVPTIDALVAEHGITRVEAEKMYVELAAQSQSRREVQSIAQKYDGDISKALEANDLKAVARLQAAKRSELKFYDHLDTGDKASFITKLNEWAISNVFSGTTLAINAVPSGVKTFVVPAIKAVVNNPLEKATRAELTATYSAMGSTFRGALAAAKASYKYEQSILTRDTGRLMEGELAIRGPKAGIIRFLPRVLNATDELLSHVNYNGFVAGRAAADAAYEGAAKGLKGEELNAFISKASDDALKGAYKQASADGLFQPIVNKGVNLGYTGEKLATYVEKEAMKSPEALRHGSDEAALDYVRDVLYKRRFSGDGSASSMAKSYEDMTMKHPWMKFAIGQMFFRTPIRVFEEGIRLTPGVNILAPGFLKDLAGSNGAARQIRAQGESLVGLSVLGATLSLYSQGKLTGSGGYDDFKQNKLRSDAPVADAYTLKMSDGSTWSYRGFDPVSTPVKIMVTGMELMNKLSIREAQGEMVGQPQWKQAQAHLMVGWMAITSAITDANLVSGLAESGKLVADMADPTKKEDAILKLIGEKLKLLVPNTLHKIAKQNDPTIEDPATFWQMVEARLHTNSVGTDIKTSKAYDVLGKPREPQETGQLWNIFSLATPEERARGMSNEGQVVLTELDRLQREVGAHFDIQHTHPLTGAFDPRTVLTKDGKETLYDRWQDNYKKLNPDKILFELVTQPIPDGTFKSKGTRVQLIQDTIKQLQDAAYMQTMGDEQQVVDAYVKKLRGDAESQGGLHDFGNLNK